MRSPGLILLFTICFISSMFGGVVSTLMSVYLPVAVRDLLGNVTEDKLNDVGAFINAVFIFGWMFGGVVWGIVCDRVGRARAVILSTLCYGLFTVLTSLAPSWPLVTACRFLSGFGVGGVLVTTTIMVSESWTGKARAVALGILSISIPVGIFSAGLINYLVSGWRQAFLTGIVPLAAAGVALLFLKESEKWRTRAVQEKTKTDFLSQPYRHNLWVGSLIFGTMLIGMWAIFSWLPTWVQSLSGSADAQHERGLSMMLMGGGGLAGGFISGWVAHAIGLRRTMLLCFSICFVMAFLLFKLNHSFSGAAYPEIAILAIFFGISQGALSAYIPELFPTAVCAAATGFCFNVGRLFTATAVFFVGALVTMLGGYSNTLFIFSFIFLMGFLATWYAR
ncbi:MAG TPA: MFS transporter, partial [Puia sp.]|nr:MFS transporter [Puia sp.]